MKKRKGPGSFALEHPPYVIGAASVVGEKEAKGPLGKYFDYVDKDPMFHKDSWEAAESNMQRLAAELALEKTHLKPEQIDVLVAGDLLGQLIATSFGVSDLGIPLLGVYGACSTMGESLALAALFIDGGFGSYTMALTSSHFASAEKQFRFPLDYGNQRPLAATWTVTGSGAIVLGEEEGPLPIQVTGVTIGTIEDYGMKDSMNMGACMAPAAGTLIAHHLEDFQRDPSYYDKIITGDLGIVGYDILLEMMDAQNISLEGRLMDCGKEIYDPETQDTHAGGSGCGCSAVTLAGMILKKMKEGEWKRVLFVPTGALLSPTSFNEGNSVPGIAHGVVLEGKN